MKRFVDTNVFVYALTEHPKFRQVVKNLAKDRGWLGGFNFDACLRRNGMGASVEILFKAEKHDLRG